MQNIVMYIYLYKFYYFIIVSLEYFVHAIKFQTYEILLRESSLGYKLHKRLWIVNVCHVLSLIV